MCVSVYLCHARLDHKRIHVRSGRYISTSSALYMMHTYSEHQFPSLKELSCHSLKSDQIQKRENAEVGNYLPTGTYRYLLIHVCQMMYMNLEGGERKLTYLPVPTYTLHVRYVCTCTLPVLYGTR